MEIAITIEVDALMIFVKQNAAGRLKQKLLILALVDIVFSISMYSQISLYHLSWFLCH